MCCCRPTIRKKISEGSFDAREKIRAFHTLQVFVISLASFIVITNQASAVIGAEIKAILEPVAASRNRLWQPPDDKFTDIAVEYFLFTEYQFSIHEVTLWLERLYILLGAVSSCLFFVVSWPTS